MERLRDGVIVHSSAHPLTHQIYVACLSGARHHSKSSGYISEQEFKISAQNICGVYLLVWGDNEQ